MIVKTFSGPSLRDALDNVRKAFGDDAVIIDTRFDSPTGGRFGHRERGVHVTAAYEPEPTDQRSPEGPRSLTLRGALADVTPVPDVQEQESLGVPAEDPDDSSLVEQPPTSMHAGDIADELIQRIRPLMSETSGINTNSALISWLTSQPRLAGEVIDAYATHVAESLPPFGPFLEREKSPLRVLFVGSRGSGRSNAMFKIAAARWRNRQIQPGIVVVSDVAARGHEQLAAVCSSCGLELLLESTHNGKFSIPRTLKKTDLFAEFVPSNTESDLTTHARSLIKSIRPDVVVLVVRATDSPAHWERVKKRFEPFAPTHLVVSHWDEYESWTEIAAFSQCHGLSLSYRISGSDLFDEIDSFTETEVRIGVSAHLGKTFAPNAKVPSRKGDAR
ncbi:MAG: hypothetical protein Kow0074_05570 [Candidatus Zixiibacteriota bacterium]